MARTCNTKVNALTETNIICPPSYLDRLPLSAIFRQQQPLEVELGTGDGSFLVAWATQNPNHNFLGVERLLGRLRKADRKCRRAGLENVRLLRIEAGYFLEYMMPERSVAALHVYFPDPWPKRKHRRHRLINEHFVGVAAKALTPDGAVYIRTDDADYFAQITAVFQASPDFEPTPAPSKLQSVLTDFERDFQTRGVSTFCVAYRRRA
ncbi:MAG: tRNA (guanosine(46)-N7)-methyltransferase TrmB [Verrucomicrobia subdivision 3 bacterium]|nr:tRNA (guanosine(46)-N7)-methyltransferase TrmB [Limisphaerales bacterium]